MRSPRRGSRRLGTAPWPGPASWALGAPIDSPEGGRGPARARPVAAVTAGPRDTAAQSHSSGGSPSGFPVSHPRGRGSRARLSRDRAIAVRHFSFPGRCVRTRPAETHGRLTGFVSSGRCSSGWGVGAAWTRGRSGLKGPERPLGPRSGPRTTDPRMQHRLPECAARPGAWRQVGPPVGGRIREASIADRLRRQRIAWEGSGGPRWCAPGTEPARGAGGRGSSGPRRLSRGRLGSDALDPERDRGWDCGR